MIDFDRNLLELRVTCDSCREEDVAAGDFKECINELKHKGWRMFKDRYHEYRHECPDCVKGPSAQEDFR